MLPFLAETLTKFFGPFRLLGSYLVLLGIGAGTAALAVWFLLPRLWRYLPRDRGKKWVKQGEEAEGKPTGAGVVIVALLIPVLILVMPFAAMQWETIGCLFLVMLTGYLDDASDHPWSETRKGLLDLEIGRAHV